MLHVSYHLCTHTYRVASLLSYVSTERFKVLSLSLPVPPSTLSMRIVPVNLETPYIGRLEVNYNEEWGTVCNYYFGKVEADLACYGLNYTNGAICSATYGFLPGRGRQMHY